MAAKLAAGNWKMNGTAASLREVAAIAQAAEDTGVPVLLCPPATLLSRMSDAARPSVMLGGQDCHAAARGAHTGDLSAEMLADAGATHVILGHSERRADHGETSAEVAAKCAAAQGVGLICVVCLGETLAQREAGQTRAVVSEQFTGSLPADCDPLALVIAYEPVWAIGTGKVATTGEIGQVHADLRAALIARFGDRGAGVSILYGGSVKAVNAAEIFAVADVDGALVGGASLKAADFVPIVQALAAS